MAKLVLKQSVKAHGPLVNMFNHVNSNIVSLNSAPLHMPYQTEDFETPVTMITLSLKCKDHQGQILWCRWTLLLNIPP